MPAVSQDAGVGCACPDYRYFYCHVDRRPNKQFKGGKTNLVPDLRGSSSCLLGPMYLGRTCWWSEHALENVLAWHIGNRERGMLALGWLSLLPFVTSGPSCLRDGVSPHSIKLLWKFHHRHPQMHLADLQGDSKCS